MNSTGRCFILENGTYTEITYQQLMEREDCRGRLMIPLHGMLMEVSEKEYKAFHKAERRQRYLEQQKAVNDTLSYDMLTTDDWSGEDILVSQEPSVEDQAVKHIMLDKLCKVLVLLSDDEIRLIRALYFRELSEREYSAETGIPQQTINDRKRRLLIKLRRLLEN